MPNDDAILRDIHAVDELVEVDILDEARLGIVIVVVDHDDDELVVYDETHLDLIEVMDEYEFVDIDDEEGDEHDKLALCTDFDAIDDETDEFEAVQLRVADVTPPTVDEVDDEVVYIIIPSETYDEMALDDLLKYAIQQTEATEYIVQLDEMSV